MDSVVTGGNVKVLAKAIHSLSRIGDELYLEPQEDGLALRSVNSSRSAYACFFFSPLFFSRFTLPVGRGFRCKMAIKCVQAVFKSLSSLEKTVEKCRIELDGERSRLTFTLHCKHGLLKTHNLSYQDCESLQAVFDKEGSANKLQAQCRLLVDTVLHFPPSLDEVTIKVSAEGVSIRNHMEDEADQSKAMLTQLCLSSEEFDRFVVSSPTSVTFCLKELRGLLVFAESTGLLVSMYLDKPGSPVVLSVNDSVLEVNFVLATLSDEAHPRNHGNSNTDRALPPADDFLNDDMDSYLIAMDTSIGAAAPSKPSPPSPQTPTRMLPTQPMANHRTGPQSDEEDEEEDVGRRPNKKFCSLLFGALCPTTSQTTNQTVLNPDVLASDSEEETQVDTP